MTNGIKFLEDIKTKKFGGGWSRNVEVDGVRYQCAISQGKRVRIAFKPRGENIGYQWHGSVYGPEKQWHFGHLDGVTKSTGCKGLLRLAGIIENTGENK